MSESAELSVTFKYGKGYEETWAVFKGKAEDLRYQVLAYFGMEPGEYEGLPLHDVVLQATRIAHADRTVMSALGANVVTKSDAPAESTPEAAQEASSEAKGEPEGPTPEEALVARLEAAETIDALKRLWAENKALFADEAVKAAYKKRGVALKG